MINGNPMNLLLYLTQDKIVGLLMGYPGVPRYTLVRLLEYSQFEPALRLDEGEGFCPQVRKWEEWRFEAVGTEKVIDESEEWLLNGFL